MSKIDDKRKVIHQKDDKFYAYVRVLMFMIENKGKSFMKMDIKHSIFGDDETKSVKVMVSRCVDFYTSANILVKVTELIKDGVKIKLKDNQTQFRLYDKDLDDPKYYDKVDNKYRDDGIEIHISEDKESREKLCTTVAGMIMGTPNLSIYDNTIATILESKIFGFETIFVSQTISQAILKNHNLNNKDGLYPLEIISAIINSQINVNVKFENFGNIITLNNTKIKKVTIREDSFDIHFDNFISQHHSDIKQIILIENFNEDGLRDSINKTKVLINDLDIKNKNEIENILSSIANIMEVFEF